MRHHLTAVFNNLGDAQQVLEALLVAGYPRSGIALISPHVAEGAGHSFDPGLGGMVRRAFAGVFGAPHPAPERVDEPGFLPGRHVITVSAAADSDSRRAIGIIERFTPVYIEDRHQ